MWGHKADGLHVHGWLCCMQLELINSIFTMKKQMRDDVLPGKKKIEKDLRSFGPLGCLKMEMQLV